MNNIRETTLAELVTRETGVAVVFEKHQLDFCCNGKRSLQEACISRNIDIDAIEAELEAVFSGESTPEQRAFDELSLSELVERIVSQHHRYVRQMIPILTAHTQKVANRHGVNNSNLVRIAELWLSLAEELTQHMYKEEHILFPFIKRLEQAAKTGNRALFPQKPFVSSPIQIMESEHDKAGEIMKEIRELSNQFTPPLMACMTYRLSFRELKEFEADLHQHIHLENNILFPKSVILEKTLIEQLASVG